MSCYETQTLRLYSSSTQCRYVAKDHAVQHVVQPFLDLILGEATGRCQTTLNLRMVDPTWSASHAFKGRNNDRLGSDGDVILKIARCRRGRVFDCRLGGILTTFRGQVCRLDLLCNLLAMVIDDGLVV